MVPTHKHLSLTSSPQDSGTQESPSESHRPDCEIIILRSPGEHGKEQREREEEKQGSVFPTMGCQFELHKAKFSASPQGLEDKEAHLSSVSEFTGGPPESPHLW